MSRIRSHLAGGWTLVEMSVVLVIAALLATIALQVLPLGIRLTEDEVAQQRLGQAEQALVGFARSHSRLPHADGDGDGREDSGITEGFLPYHTLGLPSGSAMAYSVTGLLSNPVNGHLYHPSLPASSATATPAAPEANGLDLCVLLGNVQRQLDTSAGGSYSAAFAISHRSPDQMTAPVPMITAGAMDAHMNAGTLLLHRATGVGELYSRLNCASQLNRAFASAQSAATAQSALLLAQLDSEIADFYIDVATLEHDLNVATFNLAAWNVANATFELAIGAAQAIPDIAPPVNAKKVAMAIISLGKAAKALKDAVSELLEAESTKESSLEAISTTRQHALHASEQAERIKQLRDAATAKAIQLDTQGLNP